jgi:hypothetical protein
LPFLPPRPHGGNRRAALGWAVPSRALSNWGPRLVRRRAHAKPAPRRRPRDGRTRRSHTSFPQGRRTRRCGSTRPRPRAAISRHKASP